MELTLMLAGATGAMGFGAVMVFVTRWRDLVALWLGCFLVCTAAGLSLGGDVARWTTYLAPAFFAGFVAELYPGPWPRRAAAAAAVLAGIAALAQLRALEQGLALALGLWALASSLRLVRDRASIWPALIGVLGLIYAALSFELLPAQASIAAGLVAYVITPAVVLTRRAIRAFNEEERRALDQAKFITEVLDLVPVALSMRDPQGKYLLVNKTWERYYGLRREDIIGTHPRIRTSERDTAIVMERDRAALEAGPGVSPPPQDFELNGRRYLQTRTAMADSRGKVLGVLVAGIDTTERTAIERALAIEQRRFELVVRASNAGILDWDGLTRTVYYSPRFKEILRHPPDADTSGWPDYFDLVHPDDRERVRERFRKHVLGGSPAGVFHQTIEYRLRRADNTYVWIEAFGASVRDDKGYAARFIASITDISERRFNEEALRAAVRLREEVERMSRHDLKTPLNSMIAISRLLRDSRQLGAEDAELLAAIERAGYRILNMVNLSLDLFRMEQGKYEFRPQPVDLAALAQRVAADLASQAASKGVAVRVQGAGSAHGEEILCYSMFANLVKNAIEAAPDDGTVTVTLEPRGEALLAHVHNAGVVPEEIRARFFQKYATSGKSAGLGLGTYSARLMARVQQGDIRLRTAEAEGTTVTVQLALAPQAVPEAEQPESGDAESTTTLLTACRVLIVDDDEFNRIALRHSLPTPPVQVELAVNGRAALEAARRAWPDAVLLDLEMPVMDGYEAAAALRRMEREEGKKRLTIVAVSSNDEASIIQRALAAGCDHYLVKPAQRRTLLRILAGETPEAASAAPEAQAADAVELDADLEASLPEFMNSRRSALDEMPQALAKGDRARFKRLAHKLAGSFMLYRFRWAAAQCRALERDAQAGDVDELALGAATVRAHLDTVKIRVRAVEAG